MRITRKRGESFAEALKRSKAAAKQKAAVGKLKVKKNDKLSFVFVSATGKRLRANSGKRGYLVYITRTGKKRVIKPPKLGGAAANSPHRFSTFKPTDQRRKKTAVRKVIDKHTAQMNSGFFRPRKATGAVDYKRASGTLAQRLRDTLSEISPAGKREIVIKFAATIRLKSGEIKTVIGETPIFYLSHLQPLDKQALKVFVESKVYAFLADSLTAEGFVSSGSANHIKRLKANKGKRVSEWVNRKGQAWYHRVEYSEEKVVKIVRLDWQIHRMI